VLRMGATVVALELVAVVVAYWYFGWPVLLMGAPALVGTVAVLLFVRAWEAPRRLLEEHRAARWDPEAALPGGLMSGFFEVPKQVPHR
jgi:NhaP-type Na+/H+ or K+/H+ antiporter